MQPGLPYRLETSHSLLPAPRGGYKDSVGGGKN